MLAYPDVFPSDAIAIVVQQLRGVAVPLHMSIRAVWVVVGYGLGQFVPSTDPLTLPVNETPSDEQVARSLEAYQAATTGAPAFTAALPWKVLLPVLVQLARTLFEKWASGASGSEV